MVLVSAFFIRWFVGSGTQAIALYPFIIVKSNKHLEDPILINHERIHLRQQLELLIVFFYLWYLIEYVWLRINGRSRWLAYRNIVFEREAYARERYTSYLSQRKAFAFWHFYRSKRHKF